MYVEPKAPKAFLRWKDRLIDSLGFAVALHPFRLLRPVVAFQRFPRHLASAAPDPTCAAGHPVHLLVSCFDQLVPSFWGRR